MRIVQPRRFPVPGPGLSVSLASLRRCCTWSRLWRLLLVALMSGLSVLGLWGGLLVPATMALAASHPAAPLLSTTQPPRQGTYAASISACPSLTQTPKVVGSVDGLGTLGFFTFVKQNLNDRLLLETNVANGNVVAQYNALQIHGTGLDLAIQFTYNAQSTDAGVLGANWNLSVGNGVSLSFSGGNATLHGSSGFQATYQADSSSFGGFDEPPGLDATLLSSTVNGAAHVLVFQKSSECFGFNSSGQEIFDQDKNGHQITFTYNSAGNISSITDTQNRLTSFSYDGSGRISIITDPINRTIQLSYGSNNNLTGLVDLDGKTTSFAYSGHLLTGITDPRGNTTSPFYQSGGTRLDHLIDALGNPTFYAYYAPGASQCGSVVTLPCTTVQDANHHFTTYSYKGLEVQNVVDANGNMQANTYTPDANVSQYTDALTNNTVFTFDVGNTNNLLSTTDGNKATTVFGYTNPNPYLPTTLTDAQNNTMTYGYDSTGNLTSAKDSTSGGTGSSVSYLYNTSVPFGSFLFGTLKQATDGDGHVTTYTYDSAGNLKTVTPPSPLGVETLMVDGVSRVSSETDGNGITTSFTYDNMDRLTKLAYTGGATISYTPDGNGNLTKVVDNTGTTSFSYDKDNRQLTKTLPAGATLTVTYDAVGNLHTYTDAGGTVTYDYDPANRLRQVQEPDGALTSYGYDAANHKTSISYPNGTGELFGYDAAGHVTSAIGGLMNSQGQITTAYLNFSYNYKLGSTQTQLLQSVTLLDPLGHTNSFTRTYGYDSMNRLTSAEVTNSSNQEVEEWGYTYDAAGNRLTSSVLSTSQMTSYSYNGANELTKTVQGSSAVTYSYDGMGNLKGTSNGFSYTYNAKNQTTAINAPGGNNSYTYTGPDQTERVQLNTLTDVYSGLGLSSETNSGGTTFYTRCSCGLLVNERLPGGNKDYYLFDGLGSIVGLTNSSGSEVNAYDYDPYGVIMHETTGVTNPWQYAGGYFESSTGLIKFGRRYDNPALGRWTQQDPVAGSLGQPDSLNRYLYAKDDPVNVVDPSGAYTFGQWYSAFGGCLASIVVAPGLAISGVITSVGVIGAFIAQNALSAAAAGSAAAAAASAALTAFGWVALVGAAIFIGIVVGCAVWATVNAGNQ